MEAASHRDQEAVVRDEDRRSKVDGGRVRSPSAGTAAGCILDLDANDPIHNEERRFFHGYYRHQLLSAALLIFCG